MIHAERAPATRRLALIGAATGYSAYATEIRKVIG